ncbi:MAG: serine protease [Minicystis sp.]
MNQALSKASFLGVAAALALTSAGCASSSPPEAVGEAEEAVTSETRLDLHAIDKENKIGKLAAQGQLFGIPEGAVTDNVDGTYTITTTPFVTLESGTALCDSASFYLQPHASVGGTGVIVGPDLVLTAAHTLGGPTDLTQAQAACSARMYIADYALLSASQAPASVPRRPAADVYRCKKVVYLDLAQDVALVTLNRPIAGRVPLKPRRSGTLPPWGSPERAAAVKVGYPHRLPAKFEDASIQGTSGGWFTGTGHAAVGDSGSGLVNAATGRVEGIIQSGGTRETPVAGQSCSVECTDPVTCPGSVAGPAAPAFAVAIPPLGLEIAASPDLPSVGEPGGPFTNPSAVYTLSAGASGLAVDYKITLTGPLRIAPVMFAPLAPGATRNVTVYVDAKATELLAPGVYDATVAFTDLTYGTTDTFHHTIEITEPPVGWCIGCGAAGCCGDMCCMIE